MKDTKGLPIFRSILIIAVVLVAGTSVGIDWEKLAAEVFKERHNGKEVCFTFINRPRQVVEVAWHVGITSDRFKRELRSWEHCEPAEVGEKVGLSVEKTTGRTICAIIVMPDQVQVGGSPKTVTDSKVCSVSGTVI